MHAQSLHHAMKQNHMGKALLVVQSHLSGCTWNKWGCRTFLISPIHPLNRCLNPVFLGGVPDHRLPRFELGNACMAELLNALVQIQDGREKLNYISKRLPMHKPLYESSSLSHGSYRTNTGQSLSWIDRFVSVVTSLIRTAIPAKSLG